MNNAPNAVNSYIKSLEKGYSCVIGTVYCELFHYFWFKIFGLCPGFDLLNKAMAEYFGAQFGKDPEPGDLGLEDPFYKHAYVAFVKPIFA